MTQFRRILILTVSAVCFLWNLILFLFLMSGSSGATALCCSLAGALASGFFYICARALLSKFFPINVHKRRILFTAGSLIICLSIMLCAPYSPAHDSLDMAGFLSTFVKHTTLSDYADKYLSFYGTNRICMYFYKPLVEFCQSVRVGSTISNVIFLLTAVFCISDVVYKKYGTRCGEISLFLLPQFMPYMMMSGPYIYPPAVFLSSVALCLFYSKRMSCKIISAVLFGILSVMRPTAASFWMILMLAYLILRGKRNIINNICFTIVLILVCVCSKTALENIMYSTGAYPYPSFTNSALQWTLELGLRPQGAQTGKCTYTAITGKPFDEISKTFCDLWDTYDGADDNATYKIRLLNKKLNTLIAKRAADTVFSDFDSLWNHIKIKYVNMFRDEYRPYYYAVNLSDDAFAENLYKNYEWRYFLSENVILVSFAAASMVLAGSSFINVYRRRKYPLILLCTALSVMAMLFGFVLLTEVGKRLIFDMYTPMCVIISAVYSKLVNDARKKIKKSNGMLAVCAGAGVFFLCSAQHFYSMYNTEPFKDCVRSYMPDDSIMLTLKEPVDNDGYMLWYPDGTDVHLLGRQHIVLPLKKDDRNILELTLPNGTILTITNYEYKE